jgi:hypothetical protein
VNLLHTVLRLSSSLNETFYTQTTYFDRVLRLLLYEVLLIVERVEPYVVLLSVIIIVIEGANERGSFFLGAGKIFLSFVFYRVSPGAPPAPVRLPGQKFFQEKFSPFQWTLDGGSWQQTVEVGNIFKSV